MVLGWVIAIIFICLYLDSRSRISYLKERVESISKKYNSLLEQGVDPESNEMKNLRGSLGDAVGENGVSEDAMNTL